MQMLLAVNHMSQRKFTHNDINLKNILLSKTLSTAKLSDFGNAQELGQSPKEQRFNSVL